MSIKTAIFVEGQTELIFVREMLLRVFDPEDLSFQCTRLLRQEAISANYNYRTDQNSAFSFDIIQVGNDTSLQSIIVSRAEYFWNKQYFRIIGLRDMFTPQYRKRSTQVSPELNIKIKEATYHAIKNGASKPEDIHFHYAIMELEAWLLGFKNFFEKIDARLTNTFMLEKLGIDLEQVDPEVTFLHPAEIVKKITAHFGSAYDKHEGEVNAFMANLKKEDFLELRDSGKCASFSSFFASLPSEPDYMVLA